jgi:hypothetical protein
MIERFNLSDAQLPMCWQKELPAALAEGDS